MENWEYKQVYSNVSNASNILNRFGGQGWELCASNGDMFYFKRPMKCVNCKNYMEELTYSKYGSDFYDIKCKAHKNLEIKEGYGCEKFKSKN